MEPVGAITFHTDGSYHVNDEYPVNDTTMEEKFGGNKYYLMQFTGLLDRNGKEVYEGDVVAARLFRNDAGTTIWPIEWDEVEGSYAINGYRVKHWDDVEVIGNIYEHRYLLEGGDDKDR